MYSNVKAIVIDLAMTLKENSKENNRKRQNTLLKLEFYVA